MILPLGLAALVQTAYLWRIHGWSYHNGDATYYALQAHWITQGHWFVNPFAATFGLGFVASASHPPLTSLVLALSDVLGVTSWTGHQIVMAGLFLVTVFVSGQVGRLLAGDRGGIVVASVVAVCPYLWMNPGSVLAESVELPILALLLWATLRFWRAPRLRTAVEVGVYLGLLALTRSELLVLVLLIGVPLVLLTRGLTRALRWKCLGVMTVTVLVVIGPWVGRNMTAFHHPEFLSTEGGVTLATANCHTTYYGDLEGWWYDRCYPTVKVPPHADESDTDAAMWRLGRQYVSTHESRLPTVLAIRELRIWDLFRPVQQAQLDQLDARPAWASEAGMVIFYALAPFAVSGAVLLRRRGKPLFPFVALVLTATLTALTFYANGRYRVGADLAVAILGAVAIDALIGVARRRFRPGRSDP